MKKKPLKKQTRTSHNGKKNMISKHIKRCSINFNQETTNQHYTQKPFENHLIGKNQEV